MFDERREGGDRRADEEPVRLSLPPGWALQIVAWIVAALLTYGAVNARVAVLENRVDTLKSDIGDIKADVREILKRTP